MHKTEVQAVVEEFLHGTDCYLVDLRIDKDNNIVVEIDADTQVDLDTCCALTHTIEEHFDRDQEDYSLEVGSVGITASLKLRRQYEKNIGNELEILSAGRKFLGTLVSVAEEGIVVDAQVREKGSRKLRIETLHFAYADIQQARYNLRFS